jgi:hypothetical protein
MLREPAHALDRGDGDDGAAPPAQHPIGCGRHREIRAGERELEHASPFVGRRLMRGRDDRAAHVRDDDLQITQLVGGCECLRHGRALRRVADDQRHLRTRGQLWSVVDIDDDDARSLGEEPLGGRTADARRSARDESQTAGEQPLSRRSRSPSLRAVGHRPA